MRDWEEVAERIQIELTPEHHGILKCQGEDRRKIVSNDGQTIKMYTGKNNTKPPKPITYEMIKYAFDRLKAGRVFDSPYFQKQYRKEYKSGPCRYSMVGGVLVELKLADRHPAPHRSCYYVKGTGQWTK